MSIVLVGSTSGSVTLQEPAVAGSTVINLPSVSMNIGQGGGEIATNTAFGASALGNGSQTGTVNTAIGAFSLFSNTSGTGNTGVGQGAMYLNTTGGSNSSFGDGALGNNTTGGSNTALGRQALTLNTTASNNTAVGYQSLYANTTGTKSTAVGGYALTANTTGTNTAFGYVSLYSNTTGTNNVAVGHNDGTNNAALQSATTGSSNSALGVAALGSSTTGTGNTALGYLAGSNIITGAYNIFIGPNTAGSGTGFNQEVVIGTTGGAVITGKGANTGFFNANGGGIYQGNNSSAWSVTSDQRLKKNIVDNTVGLDAITSIRVRNFEYRTEDEITELSKHCVIQKDGVQLGVIAQELQVVFPDCVKQESTGVLSVDTDNLTWYLVNAIKELKAEIDILKGQA